MIQINLKVSHLVCVKKVGGRFGWGRVLKPFAMHMYTSTYKSVSDLSEVFAICVVVYIYRDIHNSACSPYDIMQLVYDVFVAELMSLSE